MSQKTIIIGAGLSGLSAAVHLHGRGHDITVLEKSDAVGGRIRTDRVEGFLLDRGFQVYLDAYPQAGETLDLQGLNLRSFVPGALIFDQGKRHRLMDAVRCPQYLATTLSQPIGSIQDKMLVGKMRAEAMFDLGGLSANEPDLSTESYLKRYGFSDSMIDGFFRPFYGGIFLERELRTSARMFDFTFRMFAKGAATLPALGMQEIPNQLRSRLPDESVHLNTEVAECSKSSVILSKGETLIADHVIVATDAETASRFLPALHPTTPEWRSVVGIYFSAPKSPFNEPIIVLNGDSSGLVNNVCVLSDVSHHYAPEGKSLISVSVLGNPEVDKLENLVLAELGALLGESTTKWEHLRTDRIRLALPEQLPGVGNSQAPGFQIVDGVYVCGDHCTTASIEGALISGKNAATAISAAC